MTELKKILSIYLDLYLHQIIISGARTKEGASKIRIRPVVMKDKLYFQCTSTVGTKEIQRAFAGSHRGLDHHGFPAVAAGE